MASTYELRVEPHIQIFPNLAVKVIRVKLEFVLGRDRFILI